MANTASLDLDQHLVPTGKLQWGILNTETSAQLVEDGLLEGLGKRHGVDVCL